MGGKWCPGAKTWGEGENEKRKGWYNRAILWPCSIMGVRGGKDRKEDANERVQRSRREGSAWLHRRMVVEGSKGVGGQGRKEGDAGALQSLQVSWKSFSSVRRLCSAMCIWFSRSWKKNKKQNNNKTSVIVVKDPSKRKQTTFFCISSTILQDSKWLRQLKKKRDWLFKNTDNTNLKGDLALVCAENYFRETIYPLTIMIF